MGENCRGSVEVDGWRAGENFRRGAENSNLGTKNLPPEGGRLCPRTRGKGENQPKISFSLLQDCTVELEEIVQLSWR